MAKISKATIKRAHDAEKRQLKAAGVKRPTNDAYQNWQQSIGIGTNNSLTGSTYGFNPITRIRTLLEWIYRGSWFGGMAIDIIADDMTKNGIEIQSTIKPDYIEAIKNDHTELNIWGSLNSGVKWDRLYGGCIAVIMIDGQDVSTPLKIDRIPKDSFRGLLPLDRWMIESDLSNLVTTMGPDIGLPMYYRVTADAPAFRGKRIHYSRCIRFDGVELPYWQRLMENLWGCSEFERLYDRMVGFDSATMGMAQLVYKSYIRTYKIEGMRKIMSESGDAEQALMRWVEMTRRTQGNEGITMIDAKDDFIATQNGTFTGISDAVLLLAQQLGGSLGIPLARFFGQSPGGLNSTGDFEWDMYSNNINQRQERKLRRGVSTLIRVSAASRRIKLDEFNYSFVPIAQLDEDQKSQIFARDANAIMDLEASGMIELFVALKELRQLSRITGRMTNITDEDIAAAKNAPPRPREGMDEDADEDKPTKTPDRIARLRRQMNDAAREVIHLQWQRANTFGGSTNGTWCNRMRVGSEGMNLTDNPKEVTCKYCQSKINNVGLPKPYTSKDHIAVVGHDRGEIDFHGIPVVVETWKGEERFRRPSPAHYGYIRRTSSAEGQAEQMDCFVGAADDGAFIVDSYDGDKFDEHKIMLGYDSADAALRDFNAAYSGYRTPLNVSKVSINGLSDWLTVGDMKQPFASRRAA